jgi:hypothetical protein
MHVQYRSDGRIRNLPLMSQSRRTVGFLYQNTDGLWAKTFAAGPIRPGIRRMGSTGLGTCWRVKLQACQKSSMYTQFSCQRTLAEFWGVSAVLGLGSGPLGRAQSRAQLYHQVGTMQAYTDVYEVCLHVNRNHGMDVNFWSLGLHYDNCIDTLSYWDINSSLQKCRLTDWTHRCHYTVPVNGQGYFIGFLFKALHGATDGSRSATTFSMT